MSDLIDRQNAINAISKKQDTVFERDAEIDTAALYVYSECKAIIKELPSVQPDVPDTNVGDLISRQQAIDALKICDNNEDGINCHKCPLRDERWDGAWQDDETNCYTKLMRDSSILLELSSVPRKGKWIKDRDGIYHCSCCNTDYLIYEWAMKDTHYCPNCGCRMEEGDSE